MTIFRCKKIAAAGRNTYGNYSSTQNLSKKVTYSTYAGNISTESTYTPKPEDTEPTIEYLGQRPLPKPKKSAQSFDGVALQLEPQSGGTKIEAMSGYDAVPVFIGDVSDSGYTDYAISGIPSGMTVEVLNNGETGTTLNVFVSSVVSANTGVLYIPCSVPINGEEGMGDTWEAWNALSADSLHTEVLEWTWSITQNEYSTMGAIIRGPVDWDNIDSERRFCNGKGQLESDKQWLDILVKSGSYYVCVTSYNATPDDDWLVVGNNWYPADANYQFIINQVLVADNAKINCLTNNALLLSDSGGTISGGAQGGSGSTAAFWAGAANPDDAPFMVDHSGTIRAQNGIFAGYLQNKFVKLSELESGSTTVQGSAMTYYIADERANIIVDSASTHFVEYGTTLGVRHISSYSRTLQLPHACEELNGFTYKIVVPRFADVILSGTGRDQYTSQLRTRVDLPDNTGAIPGPDAEIMYDIMRNITKPTTNCYMAQLFTLRFGYFELTCLPIDGVWAWTLVDATTVMEAGAGEDEIISYTSAVRFA